MAANPEVSAHIKATIEHSRDLLGKDHNDDGEVDHIDAKVALKKVAHRRQRAEHERLDAVARAAEAMSNLYFFLEVDKYATPRAEENSPGQGAARRCFYEETPAESVIVGTYTHPNAGGKGSFSPGGGTDTTNYEVHINVADPEGKEVFAAPAVAEGRFAVHTKSAGEHVICVYAAGLERVPAAEVARRWPDGRARFHLKLDLGNSDAEVDPGEVAQKEHLTKLEQELVRLNDKVELILHELEFDLRQETKFRQDAERINGGVVWWSVLQTLWVVAVGVWQVVHLKGFFRAKKLV